MSTREHTCYQSLRIVHSICLPQEKPGNSGRHAVQNPLKKVEKLLGRTRSVSHRMRHALRKEQPQNPTARMRLTFFPKTINHRILLPELVLGSWRGIAQLTPGGTKV